MNQEVNQELIRSDHILRSHLHHLHLQVLMERWSDSDGLQHLAEQLLLQDLHLHGDSTHEPVLTEELLNGEEQREYFQSIQTMFLA